MSLAFFPSSRVTTTSGGGEERARNLWVAPVRSLPADRVWKVPEGGEGKGNASEEEKAMAWPPGACGPVGAVQRYVNYKNESKWIGPH